MTIEGRPPSYPTGSSNLTLASVLTLHIRRSEQYRDHEGEARKIDRVQQRLSGHDSWSEELKFSSCWFMVRGAGDGYKKGYKNGIPPGL